MPIKPDIRLVESIQQVFDPVFKEYGFELQENVVWNGAGENTVRAHKNDMALVYFLGVAPGFYLCSLSIFLSGQLAEKTTPIRHYHHMAVTAIAQYLDKDFQHTSTKVYTNEDLVRALEYEKEVLLQYCKDILSGDLSIWPEIVKRSEEKRTGSGQELWRLS